MTNHYWVIPGSENLHESQESHGGSSAPNPLVQLDPGLFIWTILTFIVLFLVLAKFAWKPLLAEDGSVEKLYILATAWNPGGFAVMEVVK